jgi:hypothetical protein
MLMLHLFVEAMLLGIFAVVMWALLLRFGRRIGWLLPARRLGPRQLHCVRRFDLPNE